MRNAANWEYREKDDFFICLNHRKVAFKHYRTKTDQYGLTRDFKNDGCEDCTDCPLKERCTKAKGNRQILHNPVYEGMKAKAKKSLWSDEGAQIYAGEESR
ncbi:transposase [Weizmannia acidilactici]|uniref:transposase n=1 Tax=Weizmannia acidilactici TaxID=2607726 RepID=UPI00124CE3E2